VRLHFKQVAAADRHIARAIAAGLVLPELRALWTNLQAQGVQVKHFHRYDHGERDVPDILLQRTMYQNATNEI
jgi:hypothetical protein